VNYGFGDIPGQFMAGNAAMMINGPWVINSLEAEAPDLEYTVAPIPYPEDGQPANGLGGENFSIFANSDVQDCAWDFITFTQAPENIVDWYAGLGFLPSRDLPEEQTTFWTEDPNMAVFLDQMQYARARGPLPNWPEVSEIVQLMLQEALTGQASVEEAISNAAPQIAALLGE
jgi:multiple sugar transport system substrate-binding protein